MLKQSLFILSLITASNAVDYDRVDKAFKELDCEFKDCEEKPKVIIKKEAVPVIIYKERVVEKPVEKIIYKEKIVQQEVTEPIQQEKTTEPYYFEMNPTITKKWYEDDMDAQKISPYTKDMKVNSDGWIVNKGDKSHISFNVNNLKSYKVEIVARNIWNYRKSQIITFMNDKGDTCGLKSYDYSGKGYRYYRSFGLKTNKSTGRKEEFTITLIKKNDSTIKFLVDGQRLDLVSNSKREWNLASINLTDLNLKSIKIQEYK